MTVLYPCDAVSAERLVELAAYHPGPAYIRTSRAEDARHLRARRRSSTIGGSKVLRQSASDAATVVGRGRHGVRGARRPTTPARGRHRHPRDRRVLGAADRRGDAGGRRHGRRGSRLITVEDHYEAGGLGDAVAEAVAPAGMTVRRLAVREIPRSGKPEELLERFGIGAKQIVEAVKE